MAEKEFGLLLEYIQENPRRILDYLDLLLEGHAEEALGLFRKFIFSEALAANYRGHYQRVCGLIRDYAKVAGK